jgi:hypothetical protein
MRLYTVNVSYESALSKIARKLIDEQNHTRGTP